MSTNAILGLVVAIVVIGGGAWYFSQGTGSPEGAEGTETGNEGTGVFADLMMRTGSWTCEVETFVENAPSQGTVYVSNGMVRGDFTSTIQGDVATSHMIHADSYIYTWSDAYPQGMKMRIPEGEAEGEAQAGVPGDAQVEYSCAPWGADSSKFTPPSTVTFLELGAGMPGGVPMPN